ncbi:Maf family protein [Alteraurantiacibacter aquimixticola]|uniref:Nucleoside triphosphate pyrophosphatase n=1 Tax=Alteraurantiacibacter aquimixticola TaxID=2489173 RepID=A0A4T3EYI7_9SPHN|nr:nucleoside triphosphate pyrophosphatase [Alteraurantiacibacter aquimixticola]TIX49141.1 Maf-like protein [Alteraurantiacibacter aquimixticola]
MTIVLASKSASRKAMLTDAGVAFEAMPADVDERAIEEGLGDAPPDEVALALAWAKALAVPEKERLVLGSDSLVVVDGKRFDKPASRENAAEHLRFFSGKAMQLHSAAALARGGEIVWSHAALARLHLRELSEEFIASYLDAEWPEVGYCVGVFRIEALGVQLFDRIEGDHFTVLGMPLLHVLGALRDQGELPS